MSSAGVRYGRPAQHADKALIIITCHHHYMPYANSLSTSGNALCSIQWAAAAREHKRLQFVGEAWQLPVNDTSNRSPTSASIVGSRALGGVQLLKQSSQGTGLVTLPQLALHVATAAATRCSADACSSIEHVLGAVQLQRAAATSNTGVQQAQICPPAGTTSYCPAGTCMPPAKRMPDPTARSTPDSRPTPIRMSWAHP